MLKKFLATFVAVSGYLFSIAQTTNSVETPKPAEAPVEAVPEKKPALVISGYGDAYWKYDFNKMAGNNKTSFTNSHNSFELGMASIKLEHSTGKVGIVADLGFGKRADEFSYNETAEASGGSANSKFLIKQLYLTYAVNDHFKFTAGSWATHVGYELVDPYLNRNYSMSYMFSYGPFFHTGVKAEATYGKNGFMLGIANPTDLKSTNMERKYVIAQYSTATKNDKLKAYLNFQGGKPADDIKLNQVDLVVNGTISSQFGIGYNGTVTMIKARGQDGKFGDANNWWGSALYLNYDPTSRLGLTLRNEYFSDKKQLNVFGSALEGGNIFATTLSANIKVDNLTIIPEFRLENASEEIFSKSTGAGTKSSASFLIAAIYKF
jgi:Putative beta-barrel porin-2, OmpL-like. bbp2